MMLGRYIVLLVQPLKVQNIWHLMGHGATAVCDFSLLLAICPDPFQLKGNTILVGVVVHLITLVSYLFFYFFVVQILI